MVKLFFLNALSKKYPGAESKFIWQYSVPRQKRGEKIHAQAYNTDIISLQETCGGNSTGHPANFDVPKRATPHTFRHSFATHF